MNRVITNETLVKTSCCHSGLSGIFLANNHYNPVLKKDSGQAGMTEVGKGYLSSNAAFL
jgi:hypothetical protein